MNPRRNKRKRKYRDRLYIIANILDVAREETLKTLIMYRANLSFAQLGEYLDFCVETGLLNTTSKDKKEIYQTTPKGLRYLKRYKKLYEFLRKPDGTFSDFCPVYQFY